MAVHGGDSWNIRDARSTHNQQTIRAVAIDAPFDGGGPKGSGQKSVLPFCFETFVTMLVISLGHFGAASNDPLVGIVRDR